MVGEVVQVEDAVEVVHLVLQGLGQQAFGRNLDGGLGVVESTGTSPT